MIEARVGRSIEVIIHEHIPVASTTLPASEHARHGFVKRLQERDGKAKRENNMPPEERIAPQTDWGKPPKVFKAK
jgi:hypothetical protein